MSEDGEGWNDPFEVLDFGGRDGVKVLGVSEFLCFGYGRLIRLCGVTIAVTIMCRWL